jgi:pyridoxamine 5'-phosphate oxidase
MDDLRILKDLTGLGKQYSRTGLDESNMLPCPVEQFILWMDEAIKAGTDEPNAMILSTVSKENKSSSRVVLLKYIAKEGFVFFTNYQGKKGKQLERNPNASFVFFWPSLERQVRIEGVIQMVSPSFSDNYFNSRPYDSQLGAIVSNQSQLIDSREYLLEKKEELAQAMKGKKLIRPYYWGGYILVPELIEFWQGRPNRLSDRLQYRKEGNNWLIERLAP